MVVGFDGFVIGVEFEIVVGIELVEVDVEELYYFVGVVFVGYVVGDWVFF